MHYTTESLHFSASWELLLLLPRIILLHCEAPSSSLLCFSLTTTTYKDDEEDAGT